jgi:hypothetical protein
LLLPFGASGIPPPPPPAEVIVVNPEPEIEELNLMLPLLFLFGDTLAPPSPTVTVITVPTFTV